MGLLEVLVAELLANPALGYHCAGCGQLMWNQDVYAALGNAANNTLHHMHCHSLFQERHPKPQRKKPAKRQRPR